MVRLGMTLRELSRLRVGLALSVVAAVLAATASLYHVSLFPPGLAGPPASAGAHTQILVDDTKQSVLASTFDSDSFSYLHLGATLAGSMLAEQDVRALV